ncbi:MAG: 3-oxo-5-alpha-steroid 4-dehydrogenase [Parvibaculum sp.]
MSGVVEVYDLLLIAMFVSALGVAVQGAIFPNPLGRYMDVGRWRAIKARTGWLWMEIPAALACCGFYLWFAPAYVWPALACVLMWQIHYVHRGFIFPFRLKSVDKPFPLIAVPLAIGFNTMNGFVNGWALGHADHLQSMVWFGDARFWVGLGVMIGGLYINLKSDTMLMRLRNDGSTAYKIPRGFLFEKVTAPNYLGEMLIWAGFACMSWTLAGLSFALFTTGYMIPRALTHHRWYKEKFPDYPATRKAIIPGLL